MKKLFLLVIATTYLSFQSIGQIVDLSYYGQPFSFCSSTWCKLPFSVCQTESRDFQIYFSYPYVPGGTCRPNPYRITLYFYKNNSSGLITSYQFTGSGVYASFPSSLLANISVSAGTYYAVAKFEMKPCLQAWRTVGTYTSNSIVVSPLAASPNFNINGFLPNVNGDAYDVCGGNIKLNAAITNCESAYYIGVQESNQYWDRTYDYEWGLWFGGQAPNNINLQQLATTYSYPPFYSGKVGRQGSPLLGGNIAAVEPPGNPSLIGQPRYYRIVFATGDPSWNPRFILIKVNSGCIMPYDDDSDILNLSMKILTTQLKTGKLPIISNKIELKTYNNTLNKNIIIDYYLPEKDTINISLFNSTGQKVADIVKVEAQESGNYLIKYNSSELPMGTYAVVLTTTKDKQEKKVIKE